MSFFRPYLYSQFVHTIYTFSKITNKHKSRGTRTMVCFEETMEIWTGEDRPSPPHQGPPQAPHTHTLPMFNTLTTLQNLTKLGMGA